MKKWMISGLVLILMLSCLGMNAMAEGVTFTPSVEWKEVPEIKNNIGLTGDGREAAVVNGGAYVVTPVSWVNMQNEDAINEPLARAYVNIRDRYSVGDLKAWQPDYTLRAFSLEEEVKAILEADEGETIQMLEEKLSFEVMTAAINEELTIAAELNERLKAMNLDLTAEDLVVRDLVDVYAYGIYYSYMQQAGSSVDIAFKLDIPMDTPLLVIYSDDGEYWQLLPAEFVTNAEDGFVTVHIENLGVLAFLVPAED